MRALPPDFTRHRLWYVSCRSTAPLRGILEGQLSGQAPQWVVVWRKGEWQCELHALADAWRFHLYCGTELLDVWPLTGEAAFNRANELRDSVRRGADLPHVRPRSA